MFIRTCLAGFVTTAFVGVAMAEAQVPGQKIDNGLGELAHYSLWADGKPQAVLPKRLLGESLDSGLGELPHYTQWKDITGKDPMGRAALMATHIKR